MSEPAIIRYTWSPNVPVRSATIIVGVLFCALSFLNRLNAVGHVLLILCGVISITYGVAGLVHSPRLVITEDSILFRRFFGVYTYPLYTLHGFRIDRPSGLFHRTPMLTFDIARIEDWAELHKQYDTSKKLPLPLPSMDDRQRDTLEVITLGDIGVSPAKIVHHLEECGIRNLATSLE